MKLQLNMSINKRIILSIVLATLVASVVMGLFSLYASIRTIESEARAKLQYMVKSYVNSFDVQFGEVRKIVDILENEVLEKMDITGIHDHHYLENLVEVLAPVVKQQAQNSQQSNTAYIYFNPDLTDSVHDVYYADQDGDGNVERQKNIPMEYYRGETNDGEDKSWWLGPIITKKDYWSSPYDWQMDNGRIVKFVSFTRPIYIGEELLCVIGSDFAYDEMERSINSIEIYESGYTFLLNSRLDFLIHPHYKFGENFLQVDNGRFQWMKDTLQDTDIQLVEYHSWDGQKRIAALAKLDNEWIMGMSLVKNEIFSELYEFQDLMFSFIFLIIILFGFLSYRLGRLISTPIKEIAQQVERIEEPSFAFLTHEDFLNRNDEIGILSRSIQQMSKKLSENFYKINLQNKILQEEINQRKQIQSQLDISFQILSNSKEGIFICDKDLIPVYLNQAFIEITGYDEASLEGKAIHEKAVKIDHILLRYLDTHGSWSGELVQRKRNGTKYLQFLMMNKIENNSDYYIGIIKDFTYEQSKDKTLEYLKDHDRLTNLGNKEYFGKKVNEYISMGITKEKLASLIVINLDNFRIINEAISFKTGNLLLIEVSRRLLNHLDSFDILARTDGDEFSVFITRMDSQEEVHDKVNTIFELFAVPFIVGDEEIFVTISMGVSIYPVDAANYEELLKNAHSALNYVKNNQKNGYEFFYKRIKEMTAENYEIIKNLRYALKNNEFQLYYQPQVNIQDNRIVGIEALIRWNTSKGNIPPAKFIPLAEESKLIIPIGEWVLKEACRLGYKLMKAGFSIPISVNISSIQFKDNYLVNLIKAILEESKLPAHLLEIEITEGILIENQMITASILCELKKMGIKVSIDDFGTGYSSLSYLKYYTVDQLKIDRSFIKDIPEKDDGTIAKTIIQLSKNLGIDVLAEGVETQDQIKFLEEHRCYEVQGYYFSKPLSEDELFEFIHESGNL